MDTGAARLVRLKKEDMYTGVGGGSVRGCKYVYGGQRRWSSRGTDVYIITSHFTTSRDWFIGRETSSILLSTAVICY